MILHRSSLSVSKLSFWEKIVFILWVAQFVTTVIFFSAWYKSRVKLDNSRNSSQKKRTIEHLNEFLIYCVITTLLLTKVIREKSRGGRFLWIRNWDLGWNWVDWHYWKKRVWAWADYEQLLRVVFSCFQGRKKKFNFF